MAEQQQFVDTSQSGDSYRYAGFLFRLIAYIIDTIFITLVALVLAFAAAIIWNLENEVILEVVYTASGLITIVYVVAFWAVAGGTPAS